MIHTGDVKGHEAVSTWKERAITGVGIAVIMAIMLPWGFSLPIEFPYETPVLALLAMALMSKNSLRQALATGYQSTRQFQRTLLTAAILTAIVLLFPFQWLLDLLLPDGHSKSDLGDFKFNHLIDLLAFLGKMVLSAAIAEELLFRFFLLEQWQRLAGATRWARISGCLVSSTLFGLAHANQGTPGILTTGLVGLALCITYYLSKRNLLALMLAHACIDIYGLVGLYQSA